MTDSPCSPHQQQTPCTNDSDDNDAHSAPKTSNLDEEAFQRAIRPSTEEEIEIFRRQYAYTPLGADIIHQACTGQIPFDYLSIRPWGKKLNKYLRKSRSAKKQEETQRAFLSFLASVNRNTTRLFTAQKAPSCHNRPSAWAHDLIEAFRAREYWIRSPESWLVHTRMFSPEYLFDHLVKHLFWGKKKETDQYYDIPAYANKFWHRYARWQRQHNFDGIDAKVYFHLVQGGSLHSMENPGFLLTKKEAHKVLESVENLPFKQQVLFCCVKNKGGSDALAKAFSNNHALQKLVSLEKDPEKRKQQQEAFAFAKTVMDFFIKHPEMNPEQVQDVSDFIQAMKYKPCKIRQEDGSVKKGPPPHPDFSMKGRTPASLMRLIEQWHEDLAKEEDDLQLKFKGSPYPGFRLPVENRPGYYWRFRELLSSTELLIEGRAMKHCVYSYSEKAYRKSCFIFTLEQYKPGAGHDQQPIEKQITIEVSPQKTIVQLRGYRNARPNKEQREAINLWAEGVGLEVKD